MAKKKEPTLFERLEVLRGKTELNKSEWSRLLGIKLASGYLNLQKTNNVPACWKAFLALAEHTPIKQVVSKLRASQTS